MKGEKDAIIPMNSCEDEVTVIVSVPAGVLAVVLYAMNRPHSTTSIAFEIVVFVQAVSAEPLVPAPQSIEKQLSATVVVVGA